MKNRSNSKCDKIHGMLADLAVGTLGNRDRDRVLEHVAECADCAQEMGALGRTAVLLEQASFETAPDRWDSIRSALEPRSPAVSARSVWWLARHRLQAAVAATVAIAGVAGALFLFDYQARQLEPSAVFMDHASMSWREPFADKAALGLTQVVDVAAGSETAR